MATPAITQDVSLYASNGEPVAYIAVSEERTIYLWEGEPVAYLDLGSNVYGFNGRHLGWFERGVIWMHDGNAACAVREALTVGAYLESGKYGKDAKPGKAGKERAPRKPGYTNRFGAMSCPLFLAAGK
jgi:hypothetical protein